MYSQLLKIFLVLVVECIYVCVYTDTYIHILVYQVFRSTTINLSNADLKTEGQRHLYLKQHCKKDEIFMN